MITIKESNQERRNFLHKTAIYARQSCFFPNEETIIIDGANESEKIEMSYEGFIAKFCNMNIEMELGQMVITTSNNKYIKLPTGVTTKWIPFHSMDANNKFYCGALDSTCVKKVLGKHCGNKGYFSEEGRIVLYDKSWKIIEVTIEQIAEKFGVSPKQIRIKK